jgi:hypothetical protein
MSTIKQYTSAGEAAADLTVDEAQLVLDKGAQALKDAVDAIRAGMRAGTASTLAKGEVALLDVADSIVLSTGPQIAALGVKGVVVVATKDSVLVADKARVQDLKKLLAKLNASGR